MNSKTSADNPIFDNIHIQIARYIKTQLIIKKSPNDIGQSPYNNQ